MPEPAAVTSPEPVAGVVAVTEEPYGSPDAVALLERMWADIEERYAGVDETDGRHDPGPGARPAPVALPPGDPGWAVTAEQVTRPHGLFVVARLDGEPVGCAALRPLPSGPDGVGEIKRVYTTEEARRRGVARALLDHLVAAAPGLGFRRLVLETGTRQPEALAFYEGAGWHPVVPYGEYAGSTSTRCFGLDLPSD
jgi:GNAT superfamily N-acetyltransferase